MSKSVHRVLFTLLSLFIFGMAFVLGQIPIRSSAQSAAGDLDPDENLTLPSDVRTRLSHVAPASTAEDFQPAVTFWEVLGKVKTRYVDKITDQDHLSHGAVGAMLRALRDPYSRVITPDELQLDQQQAQGIFNGSGVILGARLSGKQTPVSAAPAPGPPRRPTDTALRTWQLVVVDTAPGSSAAQAGLQTGDIISKINGQRIERAPLAGKTIDDLNLALNGASVHETTLTVLRPSTGQAMDFKMESSSVKMGGVESRMLAHGVAYVRIRLFTSYTPDDLKNSLAKLEPSRPTALLIDLRDNPGGLLESAEQVVGILAPGGSAGILDSHDESHKLEVAAASPVQPFGKVVALTDAGTANAAEMVAGALHERKAARLIGAPTFGNGLVQTVYPLSQGWAFSLTTGRLRTPMGADFNEHGLAVDRPITPDLLQGDSAILAAVPMVVALNGSR